MTVFADTYFYLALFNTRDIAHEHARSFALGYTGRIVTTEWVLTELGDAFAETQARRSLRSRFQLLRDDPKTEIVVSSTMLFEGGLWLYHSRPDKEWSLTDCISFIVMTDRGLSDALTGDHHFEQAGFHALLAD